MDVGGAPGAIVKLDAVEVHGKDGILNSVVPNTGSASKSIR
jgi:hypothetical protein